MENAKRKKQFKGVWVSREIYLDKSLTIRQKLKKAMDQDQAPPPGFLNLISGSNG